MKYRWLARYYDLLFSPYRGPGDAAREWVLQRILPYTVSACDLACGTGVTAMTLARAAIKVYAVDLSPEMCRITRAKARRSKLSVEVIEADMRSFRLPERVDLVTCEFDALNHVPHKKDLARVLKAVARALNPGGYFYFDVNNRRGFASYWRDNVWVERDGVVMVMRYGNEAEKDRAWCDIEWFVREGRCWRRHTERVEEVCWPAAQMRAALEEAGFDRIRSWDAEPFFRRANPLITKGCRTFWLARRK